MGMTSMVQDVGNASHRSAITVTDTAQAVVMGIGKKTIEIHNSISTSVMLYYGGAGVSSSTGIAITPGETKIFHAAMNRFTIYLVTGTGDSANVRIVEYEGVG